MAAQNDPLAVTDLGFTGVDFKVRFAGESDSESVYQPAFVRVGPKGMFLHWPDPPADLGKLHVEWVGCPFTPEPFRYECRVVETTGEGIQVKLDGPTPATMKEWFERISALASQREPDSALTTSKLYTGATVVSAAGLFCGALAILLPILSSGQWWNRRHFEDPAPGHGLLDCRLRLDPFSGRTGRGSCDPAEPGLEWLEDLNCNCIDCHESLNLPGRRL